jgi:hypothetical protein
VFNTRPRCEDPLKGEGSTLVWCDALSITVGLVDIVVLAAIGVCFVYMKVKSTSIENGVVSVDGSKKKRGLSSRELMIEMSTQHLQTNNQTTEEKGEKGEVIVTTNNIFGDHSEGIQVGEGNIYGGNSDIDSPSNHSNKPKRTRLNKKHLELHRRTLYGNVGGGDNGNSGKIRANSDRHLRLQLMAQRKHSTTAAVAMSPLDKSLNSQVEEKESSNHSRVCNTV